VHASDTPRGQTERVPSHEMLRLSAEIQASSEANRRDDLGCLQAPKLNAVGNEVEVVFLLAPTPCREKHTRWSESQKLCSELISSRLSASFRPCSPCNPSDHKDATCQASFHSPPQCFTPLGLSGIGLRRITRIEGTEKLLVLRGDVKRRGRTWGSSTHIKEKRVDQRIKWAPR